MMLGPRAVPVMSVLCPSCQQMVNQNPIGVLGRRGEHFILCQACRRNIWKTNEETAGGFVAFMYHNPAREASGVQSLPPPEAAAHFNTWTKWECTKCSKQVFARAREFVGGLEPEDWWWCRACQATAASAVAAAAAAKKTARPAKKAKPCGTEPPQRPNPTLDGWLLQ